MRREEGGGRRDTFGRFDIISKSRSSKRADVNILEIDAGQKIPGSGFPQIIEKFHVI
jgi:hypothetical protein